MVIIVWDILMFDQIFISPQMKRNVNINSKHDIYQLLHELPNFLRPRILGSQEKRQNFIGL